MTEIKLYEVKLQGDAILRPAAGQEFRCAEDGSVIIGDVWSDAANGKYRCTGHAADEDERVLGSHAAFRLSQTIHKIVGIQSEI